MKSNNIFTYLLYALLGALILVAGYLALEQRKKAALRAEEMQKDQAAMEQSVSANQQIDTTRQSTGSTFGGEGKSTTPTPTGTADKNGIEKDDAASKQTTGSKSLQPSKPTTATKPTTLSPKPITPQPTKQLVSKGLSTPKKSVTTTAPSGRYSVKTGVFSQVANARSEMERFVQMGYRDAEVAKYKNDTWCVIVKRTNSKSEAEKYKNDLAHRGEDTQILDAKKK